MTTMTSGFFKLPEQLRDEVYHFAWLDTPIICLSGGTHHWIAWYNCGAPVAGFTLPTFLRHRRIDSMPKMLNIFESSAERKRKRKMYDE